MLWFFNWLISVATRNNGWLENLMIKIDIGLLGQSNNQFDIASMVNDISGVDLF